MHSNYTAQVDWSVDDNTCKTGYASTRLMSQRQDIKQNVIQP